MFSNPFHGDSTLSRSAARDGFLSGDYGTGSPQSEDDSFERG